MDWIMDTIGDFFHGIFHGGDGFDKDYNARLQEDDQRSKYISLDFPWSIEVPFEEGNEIKIATPEGVELDGWLINRQGLEAIYLVDHERNNATKFPTHWQYNDPTKRSISRLGDRQDAFVKDITLENVFAGLPGSQAYPAAQALSSAAQFSERQNFSGDVCLQPFLPLLSVVGGVCIISCAVVGWRALKRRGAKRDGSSV